jgi:anaerobic selenocysteine-containing dehydrogenase
MNLDTPLAQEPGEYATFCRICTATCGTRVTVDEHGHITRIVGDDLNVLSSGYACFKGLQSGPAHRDPARLTQPLKRQADGSYATIPLEQALDEIAARIGSVVAENGPKALGLFAGTGSLMNQSAVGASRGFLQAMGSDQYYTTITIDQSGKMVAAGRMGSWAGGVAELDDSDVLLLFGLNPLISHSTLSVLGLDPVKRLKRARKRGMKLIVVDPRRTETGAHADMVLQPYPGEDATIAAVLRTLRRGAAHGRTQGGGRALHCRNGGAESRPRTGVSAHPGRHVRAAAQPRAGADRHRSEHGAFLQPRRPHGPVAQRDLRTVPSRRRQGPVGRHAQSGPGILR